MGTRLYVGNLSYNSTEDDVRAAFEQDGRVVKDIHLPIDRETNRPRGFAFVEMNSSAEAEEAINQMDGAELDGRNLKVNEAKPRENRGGGGGHHGGGGDRQRSQRSQGGRNERW